MRLATEQDLREEEQNERQNGASPESRENYRLGALCAHHSTYSLVRRRELGTEVPFEGIGRKGCSIDMSK